MVDDLLNYAAHVLGSLGAMVGAWVALRRWRRIADDRKVKALRQLAMTAGRHAAADYRNAVVGLIEAYRGHRDVVAQAERLMLDIEDLDAAEGEEKQTMMLAWRKQHRFVVHLAGRALKMDAMVIGALAGP